MKIRIIMMAALLGLSSSACRKLDQPVEAYFFVNDAGSETYTLIINDEEIGVIPEIDSLAVPCEPSSLIGTRNHDLKLKRNKFQLKNSAGTIVGEGKFRISENGSLSYNMTGEGGHSYAALKDNVFVLGFNTDVDLNETHPNDACH